MPSDEKQSSGDDVKSKEKQPAGGHDATPLPDTPLGYTLRFTFHSATNLPMSDFPQRTSDPFIVATLRHSTPSRHKEDPYLTFRTRTQHHTLEPTWDSSWVVANLPSTFTLKLRVMDEDPCDDDDKLGSLHIHVKGVDEHYEGFKKREFELKKRSASWRAYGIRWLAVGCGCAHIHASVVVSIENLGKTEAKDGRVHTVGPLHWSQHFSPLIGRLAGTDQNDEEGGPKRYDFEANQLQLQGPLPPELYHRFVEFKPFVKGMFDAMGLRGRTLHWLLHHQHNRIYNFDQETRYGTLEGPGEELSAQFLRLVHYDEGGRLFTYVLTLDGLLRFTETGKEFGIDLLSKHTMHSDVQPFIACSGEFFVRRLERKEEGSNPVDTQDSHPPKGEKSPTRDLSLFELIIDNDSGTYRPKGDLMPLVERYLKTQFKGLNIRAMTCDDDHLQEAKKQQAEIKKKEGQGVIYMQGDNSSSSSMSSSDASDLEGRVQDAAREEEREAEEEEKQEKRSPIERLKHPRQGLADWATGE